MSHLTYASYEGYGERAKKNLWYSQAVRVGDIIECAGQGGWDRETDKIDTNIIIQIEKAFENVECALRAAGSRGWEDVFFLRSHHLPCNNEAMETMVRCLKKYCPNHQPAWTALGVPRLAFDDMRVEIEVRAHIPGDREENPKPGLLPGRVIVKMAMVPCIPAREWEVFDLHRHDWQGQHDGVIQWWIKVAEK